MAKSGRKETTSQTKIGQFLRNLRGNRTLREISLKTGISFQTISLLERGYDSMGKPANPRLSTLKALANIYQIPLDELLKMI